MASESPISADRESRIARKQSAAFDTAQASRPSSEEYNLSDYRQRYGLSVDPFDSDPHFPLFTGAQRREVLDQLLHLCQFGNSVLVVLGDSGAGKTRMANALVDSMGSADETCLIDAQPEQTVEDLLSSIAHTFGLRRSGAESAGQLLAALRSFSQPVMGSNDLALVVIDNAQNLNDQTLAALLSLLQGREGDNRRLHLAFFAELSLIGRLDQLDMQDVLINDFYLESFTLNETVDYLNFRMEMSDYLGPEIFNESMVDPWWRHARGQLPIVHDYARQHLAESVLPPLSSAGKPFPLLHIVAAALLGAAFLMTLFYGTDDKEEEAGSVVSESISIVPIQPLQSSAPGEMAKVLDSPEISSAPAVDDVLQPDSASSIIRPEGQGLDETPATPVTLPSVDDQPLPTPVASEPIPQKPLPPASTEVTPEKSTASVTVPVQKKNQLSEDEQILMSWRATEFTLQLLGVSTEKAARDFIASQSNRADLLMFKSLRQGKSWFVVVAGRYSSSAAARQAVASLPSAQQQAGPWPRDLKTVQQEVTSVRGL